MPNPLLQNPFGGVSTNPRDYVRGINPYAPDPMQPQTPEAQPADDEQPDFNMLAQGIADPAYAPDPRYTRALEMLEDLALNPASKRAKAAEDKHYGKGKKKVLMTALEIFGGLGKRDYKTPYERLLPREQEADKGTLAALGQLIPGMKNIEAEQVKGAYKEYSDKLKAAAIRDSNKVKMYKAATERGVADNQKEYWAQRAAKIGFEAAFQELQNKHVENTGSLLSKTPDEAKLWGIFAGTDSAKMTPEQARKAAYDKALLAPGVLSKAFGGQTRTFVSPARTFKSEYGAGGELLSRGWLEGPPRVSTSIIGGNDGLAQEIRKNFGATSGTPPAPEQPQEPPAPLQGTRPNQNYPTPIKSNVSVPSPIGGISGVHLRTEEPKYDSAAAARIAYEDQKQKNIRNEVSRTGRTSVVRLWNRGVLNKFSGYVSGNQTAQALYSLLDKNFPENTNMRKFLGRQYWDELFAYTGKQTNEREQKLAKEITPDPGTQNSKQLLQNALTASVFNDALTWRESKLQGSVFEVSKAFPLEKAVDAARKLYDDMLRAQRRGKPLSEEVIAKRLDPETIYAQEIRGLSGQKYPWDVRK